MLWTSLLGSLFPPLTKEEGEARERVRVDQEINSLKLLRKKIKRNLRKYRKEKFHLRMEGVPASIEMIHIDGLGKTSDSLVMDQVQDLFEVNSFQDIISTAKIVHKNLKNLGCFKSVNMKIDTFSTAANSYQVNIEVQEAPALFLNLGTVVGPAINQLQGAVRFGFNNLLGGGERVETEINRDWNRSNLLNCSFIKPLHSLPTGSLLKMSLGQEVTEPAGLRSLVTRSGPRVGLSLCGLDKALSMNTELSALWDQASHIVHKDSQGRVIWDPSMELAGHRLKAQLHTNISLSLLDCPLLPSSGLKLGADNLLSYTPGHPLANNIQLTASFHLPLPRLHTSLSLRTLLSHNRGNSPLDRSPLLSSPLVSRGVRPDSQPTNLLVVLGLTSKLPLLAENSLLGQKMRLHSFLSTQGLSRDLQTTLGVGVVGRLLDLARVELNYCLPLRGGGKQGLEFSFATEFL